MSDASTSSWTFSAPAENGSISVTRLDVGPVCVVLSAKAGTRPPSHPKDGQPPGEEERTVLARWGNKCSELAADYGWIGPIVLLVVTEDAAVPGWRELIGDQEWHRGGFSLFVTTPGGADRVRKDLLSPTPPALSTDSTVQEDLATLWERSADQELREKFAAEWAQVVSQANRPASGQEATEREPPPAALDAGRLKVLKVSGFRGLPALELDNLDADIVLVLGPNGVGKSSLIESVHWLLTGAVADRSRESITSQSPHSAGSTSEDGSATTAQDPAVPDVTGTFSGIGENAVPEVTLKRTWRTHEERPEFTRQKRPLPALRVTDPFPNGLAGRLMTFLPEHIQTLHDSASAGESILDYFGRTGAALKAFDAVLSKRESAAQNGLHMLPVDLRSAAEALTAGRWGELLEELCGDPETGRPARANLETLSAMNLWAPTFPVQVSGYRARLSSISVIRRALESDSSLIAASREEVDALADAVTREFDGVHTELDGVLAELAQVSGRIGRRLEEVRAQEGHEPSEHDRDGLLAQFESLRQAIAAVVAGLDGLAWRSPGSGDGVAGVRAALNEPSGLDAWAAALEDPALNQLRETGRSELGQVLHGLERGRGAWSSGPPEVASIAWEMARVNPARLGALAARVDELDRALLTSVRVADRHYERLLASRERLQRALAERSGTGELKEQADKWEEAYSSLRNARAEYRPSARLRLATTAFTTALHGLTRRPGMEEDLNLLSRARRCVATMIAAEETRRNVTPELQRVFGEVLGRFHHQLGPAKLSAAKSGEGDLTRAELNVLTADNRREPHFSTGQLAQTGIAWLVAQRLVVDKHPQRLFPGRVLLLDDVTSSYDITNIAREAILWRQIAYHPTESERLQIILSSHHDLMTNQILDALAPPAGCSMRVIQLRGWSPERGPTHNTYTVAPSTALGTPFATDLANLLRFGQPHPLTGPP